MTASIRTWLVSRVAVIILVLGIAAVAGIGAEVHPQASGWWWLDRFTYWDSFHFTRIADEGWFTPTRRCCDQSYFPGYPLAMRWLASVLPGPTALAGWLITLFTGTVAAGALYQLARADGLPDLGARRAVLLLAVAPFTVFTVAVYSEALWLAAALVAWWAARAQRWALSALAASVATATRITGLFLLAGLAVGYAVTARSRAQEHGWGRVAARALWLGVPVLPVVAFMSYLYTQTGSWFAWREAQVIGWGRHSSTPWGGVVGQWESLIRAPSGWLLFPRVLDLVAVLLGLALTAVLLSRPRWWPEAAYVGVSVLAIMATSRWDSAGRYALTWFPAYLVLAHWLQGRSRRWTVLALGASGLVATAVTVWFATRHWIG